jgi:hypothetical protein
MWALEHDASWSSMSLLCAIGRHGLAKDVLSEGSIEACIAYRMRKYPHEMTIIKSATTYENWKQNFGLSDRQGAHNDRGLPKTYGDIEDM